MLDAIPKEVIGLLGIAIGAGLGYLGTKRAADTNLKIAREKLESENRTTTAASTAIRQLLQHPQWELRTFDAIKKHVRGFADDDLRQLLVACGAISFEERATKRELWGLRDRNGSKLEPESGQESFDVEPPNPAAF